ncbi:hypothetical protein Tco_0311421 [Tanacetum coccineum]
MANLEFLPDKSNMVAYLKKPTGSEGFQEIIDFINGIHIRYTLTKNPTIYVSLIKKFRQTATVRTVDNGEQEITATVDGKEFTITKHYEAVYEEWDDIVERATTTTASLDADGEGCSPGCKKAIGGSTTQTRLRVGVTLITPTQGEDQPEDQLGVLSTAKILADAAKTNVYTYTRRRRAVSTSSGGISTASRLFSTAEESVSTAGMVQEVNISIPLPIVIKDKCKGKMEEYEDEQIKRTKLQQEQDRLGHEAAVRLQEELDKEERQRMARVHEAAQSFTKEE